MANELDVRGIPAASPTGVPRKFPVCGAYGFFETTWVEVHRAGTSGHRAWLRHLAVAGLVNIHCAICVVYLRDAAGRTRCGHFPIGRKHRTEGHRPQIGAPNSSRAGIERPEMGSVLTAPSPGRYVRGREEKPLICAETGSGNLRLYTPSGVTP